MFEKIKIKFAAIKKIFPTTIFVFLLVMPTSTDYKLKDYGFGNGGVSNATSNNYAMDAIAGEQSGSQAASGNYKVGSGLIFTNQANVPMTPTFSNPGNYYNKLQLILDTAGNSTDTKYAIAISTDDFVTTNYVQNDSTVGTTLGLEDYQTFTALGGTNGFYIIGLTADTTYKVKVKAMQGKFTETGYGPIASAMTVDSTLSFDIDVSATNTKTAPPFSITFDSLLANAVVDSPQKVWIDFSTNGEFGGKVYVVSQNAGLLSPSRNYKIDSVAGDLASLTEGFGIQGSSVGESSGGPLAITAAYNQTNNVVGKIDSVVREVFSSVGPIVDGRGSFILKAKSSSVTPSANDYNDILTVIASGNF